MLPGCTKFSWAPVGGDHKHPDNTVCTLYSESMDFDYDLDPGWGPNQIFCIRD